MANTVELLVHFLVESAGDQDVKDKAKSVVPADKQPHADGRKGRTFQLTIRMER
jgi:hypothetical protein